MTRWILFGVAAGGGDDSSKLVEGRTWIVPASGGSGGLIG
jgi:hypothetical protein